MVDKRCQKNLLAHVDDFAGAASSRDGAATQLACFLDAVHI